MSVTKYKLGSFKDKVKPFVRKNSLKAKIEMATKEPLKVAGIKSKKT